MRKTIKDRGLGIITALIASFISFLVYSFVGAFPKREYVDEKVTKNKELLLGEINEVRLDVEENRGEFKAIKKALCIMDKRTCKL